MEMSHPDRTNLDEPDARRAYAPDIGRSSWSGAEYETEKAQTKDGAGGLEERTCARGRDMRLLKIGESRTRMRVYVTIYMIAAFFQLVR